MKVVRGVGAIAPIAFLLGIIMILGSGDIPKGDWSDLLHEIGFALLVSVFIWIIFEIRRSQALDEEWDQRIERVTNNVFFAVLRKDLPKDLVNEASAIALSHSILRSNFNVVYTLKDADYEQSAECHGKCVLVSSVVSCRMTNIGAEPVPYEAAITLPNPVHPGMKKLTALHHLTVTQDQKRVDLGRTAAEAEKEFRCSLQNDALTAVKYFAGRMTLAPGATIEFRADYTMAKEGEDTELLQTSYPSDGLTVTVTDQVEEMKRLIFARSVHRTALENQSSTGAPNTKIFRIPGYLLPHQGVLIWWKKVG